MRSFEPVSFCIQKSFFVISCQLKTFAGSRSPKECKNCLKASSKLPVSNTFFAKQFKYHFHHHLLSLIQASAQNGYKGKLSNLPFPLFSCRTCTESNLASQRSHLPVQLPPPLKITNELGPEAAKGRRLTTYSLRGAK